MGAQTPNTSVEPTAYAVLIRIVMDSLFTLMSFHSPLPGCGSLLSVRPRFFFYIA